MSFTHNISQKSTQLWLNCCLSLFLRVVSLTNEDDEITELLEQVHITNHNGY